MRWRIFFNLLSGRQIRVFFWNKINALTLNYARILLI